MTIWSSLNNEAPEPALGLSQMKILADSYLDKDCHSDLRSSGMQLPLLPIIMDEVNLIAWFEVRVPHCHAHKVGRILSLLSPEPEKLPNGCYRSQPMRTAFIRLKNGTIQTNQATMLNTKHCQEYFGGLWCSSLSLYRFFSSI